MYNVFILGISNVPREIGAEIFSLSHPSITTSYTQDNRGHHNKFLDQVAITFETNSSYTTEQLIKEIKLESPGFDISNGQIELDGFPF